MSFLPEGIGGDYVDYNGYNKEYSEFVYIYEYCVVIKLNQIAIFTFL